LNDTKQKLLDKATAVDESVAAAKEAKLAISNALESDKEAAKKQFNEA
jgi:hypothetical protein